MIERMAQFLEQRLQISPEQALTVLRAILVMLAALSFVLLSTFIVALDSIVVQLSDVATLQEGDLAPRDIVAPDNANPYPSDIRTEQRRQEARESVPPIYSAPDPDVARQQTRLAEQILNFIANVRADKYASLTQKLADLNAITALSLDADVRENILQFDDETWNDITDEITTVLSRVMRGEIRPSEENSVRMRLSNQVNTARFNVRQSNVIVAIVEDLILPNTFEDVEATEAAREERAAQVEPAMISYNPGELIVGRQERIDALAYEALVKLNLLQSNDDRLQEVLRALLASAVVMVIIGLYISRFAPHLLSKHTRRLSLLAVIFLITLAGTRLLGVNGSIYLFPAAVLALVYVAIDGVHVAIIGALGLALLAGLMADDSLRVATFIASGSIIGALTLRRAERLNSFFVAGAAVGAMNIAVVGVFNLTALQGTVTQETLTTQFALALVSGALLVPATALAVMYVVTMFFNLPTALKMIDLSQPNKPLLQRLLRQAPGTYQHSLQVANLAEQAANAIGADAQLTHVAALYHDIGKMNNPLYFTENQQNIGNPHDRLNDPYRSADIIISHVTEGDELAKHYRLPYRLRDFIREHHGTTQVYVFYQRALNQVDGDTSAVDIADFTYPGPRPRSKETAILMLADSCEAAVRSMNPQTRTEISDLVEGIIERKLSSGQLNDSGLTLKDLEQIQVIFVEILQGMFHPRINYQEAVSKKPEATPKSTPKAPAAPAVPAKSEPHAANEARPAVPAPAQNNAAADSVPAAAERVPVANRTNEAPPSPEPPAAEEDEQELEVEEDEPLPEVPRLPTLDERRKNDAPSDANGSPEESDS